MIIGDLIMSAYWVAIVLAIHGVWICYRRYLGLWGSDKIKLKMLRRGL